MPNITKRRIFLINPNYQLRALAVMFGTTLLVLGIVYGANYYFFYKFYQMAKEAGLSPDHVFLKFIGEQESIMSVIFGWTSVLVLVIVSVVSLVLSHRTAGPLYRLNGHMNRIADGGDISEVKFRKNDFFPELAEAYNRQIKRFIR